MEYRVKTFLFVEAGSEAEAEQVAKELIYGLMANGTIRKAMVRGNSAKAVPADNNKEQAKR